MKISDVKTFIVDGGFRPWTFVKVETDSGLVGWGDCTDWGTPKPIVSMVQSLSERIIGDDPLNTGYIWQKLSAFCVRHAFGIAHKAMAGIDSALWDIRGKYFDAPVWQLLGGKLRDELPLYWTHFGTSRLRVPEVVDRSPLRKPEDLAALCAEAKELGFQAVKTNMGVADIFGYKIPSGSPGFPYEELRPTLRAVDRQFSLMRDELGPDIGIALDVAFSFQMEGAIRLARELEQYDMMWLETESFDPKTIKSISQSTTTPLCMGESLFGTAQYKPFLEEQAVGIVMPDLAWNGVTMGKRIADLAHAFDTLFAPHNCHSPLTTLISAQVSAAVPNFFMLEFDYDDVPWRDDLLEHPFEISNGRLRVPDRPGHGSDLIEEELLKHPPGTYPFR